MLNTRLCELLKVEYPIFQGGMAWASFGELAAAVSQAGGIGIIGSGQAPPDWLLGEIRKVQERTSKPFGVNIMLQSPYAEDNMKLVMDERVPLVTTGAGNPGKYISGLKERNIKIIPVIASVALAKRLEKSGVDAVIAEGTESGGHIGELTTMVLVPQVADAVEIPVVAAGGIADGRGLLAALSLGAEGIQMGTRFLCATECTIHPRVKEAIIKAGDRDTVVTGRTTGHPVRVLNNKLARKFNELEKKAAPVEELEALGVGKLRAAMIDGDISYGSVMSGQIAGLIKEEKRAADIISDIVKQAEEEFNRIASYLKKGNT